MKGLNVITSLLLPLQAHGAGAGGIRQAGSSPLPRQTQRGLGRRLLKGRAGGSLTWTSFSVFDPFCGMNTPPASLWIVRFWNLFTTESEALSLWVTLTPERPCCWDLAFLGEPCASHFWGAAAPVLLLLGFYFPDPTPSLLLKISVRIRLLERCSEK